MNESKLKAAITFFEDTIRESEEIIAECTPALQDELTEQKEYFIVALEAMHTTLPDNCANNDCPYQRGKPCPAAGGCGGFETDNKALTVETNADRIRAMSDEELARNNVHKSVVCHSAPSPINWAICDMWETSDGSQFSDKGEAIVYELDWLSRPAEED